MCRTLKLSAPVALVLLSGACRPQNTPKNAASTAPPRISPFCNDKPIEYIYLSTASDGMGKLASQDQPHSYTVNLLPGEERHAALLETIRYAGLNTLDGYEDIGITQFLGPERKLSKLPLRQGSLLVQRVDGKTVRMGIFEGGYVAVETPDGAVTGYRGAVNLYKVMFLCRPPRSNGEPVERSP